MDHLGKTGGVFLVNRAGGSTLNWNANALPVLGWQYMQESLVALRLAGAAAETGASECIVGILIRLVVYVKTIVIALYLVCRFVSDKLQSAKIWPL